MFQNEINDLASKFNLEPSKQHQGSDNLFRFYLTQDLPGNRYLQASVKYPGDAADLNGNVHAHVGLYGERKLADDGTASYDSVEAAVLDIVTRFERLRSH